MHDTPPPVIDVDALAQEIRRVDGAHRMGAGMLAEALAPYLERLLETRKPATEDREAIRLLVSEGYVSEDAANAALNIAHGFARGPIEFEIGGKSPTVPESVLYAPRWPTGLRQDTAYELRCDDKGRNGKTWLRAFVAPDGDAHLMMQEWEDHPEGEPSVLPTLRCRTLSGGGRNMRTHQALLLLMRAIQLDNEEQEARAARMPAARGGSRV